MKTSHLGIVCPINGNNLKIKKISSVYEPKGYINT